MDQDYDSAGHNDCGRPIVDGAISFSGSISAEWCEYCVDTTRAYRPCCCHRCNLAREEKEEHLHGEIEPERLAVQGEFRALAELR